MMEDTTLIVDVSRISIDVSLSMSRSRYCGRCFDLDREIRLGVAHLLKEDLTLDSDCLGVEVWFEQSLLLFAGFD